MSEQTEKDYSTELSPETLAVLQQFLQEKSAEVMDPSKEDWSLAQFWYEPETRSALSKEVIKMSKGGSIAVVSAPSVFVTLDEMKVENQVILFEYDTRFENDFGEDRFCFYDCDKNLEIPEKYHHHFDFVICDPPRLNKETTASFLETVSLLAKSPETPFILVTASFLREHIEETYHLHTASFIPRHKQLLNPMSIYTSYVSEGLGCETD
ncbi:putative EEF1A lysine methyltransferase 1 [Monocercomonoides exilis]|uniref:putative EEF1A lysine methyltransferase 1 n=1 Tax=Monocercomonoides exilis TaxID=2049356 RepID=UPI00355AA9EA|nr:putative EEF1A lysine methyltransferase 1 [Monocercomonoides exilis]|eukprot:MONOS_10641.1-p1 / transcript=MONOS_10641.1 / gene=MONOS_10641 / organism=Monocercomonoides_exilis_PA203 / gene_product=N / transcript_product=N / location=Mono_scaffold00492:1544-2400(+) / protein_length=209 / sequence_SO=supercontig / SO=protein_coding / is_pseudo=false